VVTAADDVPARRAARIVRAFNAAFRRLCEARSVEDAEDELSNLLCQLYRLGELVRATMGTDAAFYGALKGTEQGRAADAAMWARKFDTHNAVVVAELGDVWSDFFTEMFGVLVWRPLDQLPQMTAKQGQHLGYAGHLAGRSVLDTTRGAFDALASMVT
jgi:hypothetical protein